MDADFALPINLHTRCDAPIGVSSMGNHHMHGENPHESMDFSRSVGQIHTLKAGLDPTQPWVRTAASRSEGSFFVIKFAKKTFLVTNHHCVSGAAKISVSFPKYGKKKFAVRIVADSSERDLTLLRLSGKEDLDLIPLKIANSDKVASGTPVLAVGYPLGMSGQKITEGVMSGFEMMHGLSYLETDTSLNPGNSGGALLQKIGEEFQVVGINNVS